MDIPRYNMYERNKEKKCAFPDCETTFLGTGKSKYCDEHRLRKYRKVIDEGKIKKNGVTYKNVNLAIKHSYESPTSINLNCECCNEEYQVVVYPDVFVYPRFCPTHRNEFKRLMYLRQHGMITEMEHKSIEMPDEELEELNFDLIQELHNDFIH